MFFGTEIAKSVDMSFLDWGGIFTVSTFFKSKPALRLVARVGEYAFELSLVYLIVSSAILCFKQLEIKGEKIHKCRKEKAVCTEN